MSKGFVTLCCFLCLTVLVYPLPDEVPNYGYTASPVPSPPTYKPPRPPKLPQVTFPPATSISPPSNDGWYLSSSYMHLIPIGIVSCFMYFSGVM